MKKRSLLLVVSLLCIASLMAAMAYSTARVTNAADLTIKTTSASLLALKKGNYHQSMSQTGLRDNTVEVVDGNLVFNFNKGQNNTLYGLQKNSEYVWNNKTSGLFRIQNYSNDTINMSIKAENVPEGVDIYVTVTQSNGTENWVSLKGDGFTQRMGRFGESAYGIKIVVSNNARLDVTNGMVIVVSGTAVE